MTFRSLLPLRQYLSIVHHIPGRVRLRVSKQALTSGSGLTINGFQELVDQTEGLLSLKVSKPTLSAVIEYDRNQVAPDVWELLVNGSDETALAAIDSFERAK